MNKHKKNAPHAFKKGVLVLVSAASLLLAGCSGFSAGKGPSKETVTVYKNGAIYTVNKSQPWAEAIVIENGIIKMVGSNTQAQGFEASAANVIDLQGRMMMPGFHDVHTHPIESASENTQFSLNSQEDDAEDFIQPIRKAGKDFRHAKWLVGYGHYVGTLLNAKRNPVDILDDAVDSRPVVIMSESSHSVWANTKALEKLGIDENTPDPVGGKIMHDKNGKPNGILIDNAGEMAFDMALEATAKKEQIDYEGMVYYTLPQLAKNGITSISDARVYWKRGHQNVWNRLEQEDQLTVRVTAALWSYASEDDDRQIAMFKSLYSNNPNSLLRFNQIKMYSDGLIQNTTAAFKTPYQFDLLGIEGNKGLNYFSEARMAKYISELEVTGFDFLIHAIGDRGIHEALNAIEQSGTKEGRHRITHVEILDPVDAKRFAQINATADCQVAGDWSNPEHWGELAEFIDEDKTHNQIPLKDLAQAGARLTLSSDWSVSPFNPFLGLSNAVSRAPQNISMEEALAAYTINSAYSMRQDDKVGSIEVGKEADLVVLNQNLFKIDQSKIKDTKILQTLLAGEEVYRSSDL